MSNTVCCKTEQEAFEAGKALFKALCAGTALSVGELRTGIVHIADHDMEKGLVNYDLMHKAVDGFQDAMEIEMLAQGVAQNEWWVLGSTYHEQGVELSVLFKGESKTCMNLAKSLLP